MGFHKLWKTDTYIPREDIAYDRDQLPSSNSYFLSWTFLLFVAVCKLLQATWTFSSCIFLFPQDQFSRGISTLSESKLFLFVSGKADGENKSLIYDLEDTFVWQDFVTPYTSFEFNFSWRLRTDRKIKLETGDSSQRQYSVLNPHAAITDPLLPGAVPGKAVPAACYSSTLTLVCNGSGLSGGEGGVEMGFWGQHHLYSAQQQQQSCMSSRGLGQQESA